MARRRFWPVAAVIVVVGVPVNLFSMYMGAEVVLAVWYALCGALLAPAVLRRLDDAGISRALSPIVLAPLALAVLAALMVPLICLDGVASVTHDAVYTSLMLWIPCLLPMVFVCSWPSSTTATASLLDGGCR